MRIQGVRQKNQTTILFQKNIPSMDAIHLSDGLGE